MCGCNHNCWCNFSGRCDGYCLFYTGFSLSQLDSSCESSSWKISGFRLTKRDSYEQKRLFAPLGNDGRSYYASYSETGFLLQTPFTTLRRNVGTFVGRGGTIGWLATGNSLVAVDSQFPGSAQTCLDGLKEKTDHVMDYLINTHHHGDHTAGNPIFKDFAKHIVAHQNVPKLQKISAEGRGQEAVDAQVYADLTYNDKWSEDVGDETVHLMHFGPAHTGGDSVVYFEKANVAHMGDLMFNRAYPFIDIKSSENWEVKPYSYFIPWWIFFSKCRPSGVSLLDFIKSFKIDNVIFKQNIIYLSIIYLSIKYYFCKYLNVFILLTNK